MKHSVNGKSFDDIFAQRGKRANKRKLKVGNVYFADQSGIWNVNWLFAFTSLKNKKLIGSSCIASNAKYYNTVSFGIDESDFKLLREATPDQIDLLNSYKNQDI